MNLFWNDQQKGFNFTWKKIKIYVQLKITMKYEWCGNPKIQKKIEKKGAQFFTHSNIPWFEVNLLICFLSMFKKKLTPTKLDLKRRKYWVGNEALF